MAVRPRAARPRGPVLPEQLPQQAALVARVRLRQEHIDRQGKAHEQIAAEPEPPWSPPARPPAARARAQGTRAQPG